MFFRSIYDYVNNNVFIKINFNLSSIYVRSCQKITFCASVGMVTWKAAAKRLAILAKCTIRTCHRAVNAKKPYFTHLQKKKKIGNQIV